MFFFLFSLFSFLLRFNYVSLHLRLPCLSFVENLGFVQLRAAENNSFVWNDIFHSHFSSHPSEENFPVKHTRGRYISLSTKENVTLVVSLYGTYERSSKTRFKVFNLSILCLYNKC